MFNGSSGSASSATTVSVGAGTLQGFVIFQDQVEVITTFGSTTRTPLQTGLTGQGLGNYELNFAVSGLPAGVTASFSPNPAPVGASVAMSTTAPASGQWIPNTLIQVIATPSAAVPPQSLPLDFVLAPPPGSLPNNRSDYLRTDATPTSIVYDVAHQQLFSSDFFLNRVDVVSTTNRQLIKSIPVPCPDGLALSPDGTEVFVGSDAQQVAAISTTSLAVVQQ